ncbi:MAG TPA: MFS transporter [Gemmatimonadaceae bacterium]|nr:MFS transporter [Gemmatimonadaceae bacterium]
MNGSSSGGAAADVPAARDAAVASKAPNAAAPRVKLVWIAALYFASGFPYGLVNELLPVYLRTAGVDVAAIGHVVSLVSWPWALKFLWAPLVDRVGTRKSWIVACQLVLGALTALLAIHRGATLTAGVAVALFCLATLSATQDVAIDAYSIELLEERERGPANGIRVTFYRLALIATSGALVAASGYVGWPAVFVAAAATMGVLALVTSTVPATRRAADGRVESLWEPLWALLRRPHAWAILLFVLLFRLGDYALQTMIKPFWVDSHYSTQEIGLIQGTVGIAAVVAGAIVGGVLVPRLGTFRALIALGAAQAAGSLTYWLVALAGAPRPAMWGASVIEHFTYGLGTAAFMTYLMSVCERRYAATQFAVLTALFAVSRSIGAYFAGDAVQAMGYPNFFLLTLVLALPAWLLLPALRRTVER